MIQRLIVLFFTTWLWGACFCFAATTQIHDTLQLSDGDQSNTLSGLIRSPEEDLHWQFHLGLTSYFSKLETADKVTVFRSDLEFQFASNFIVGTGVNFGYAALEKLTSVEPHATLGFQVDRAQARFTFFSTDYRQGASPSQPSAGNVNESDAYHFKMNGVTMDLFAQFQPWLDGRFAWTQQTSNSDFSFRSTAQSGTRFTARRFGPIVSTLLEIPKQYQTFELIFHPLLNMEVDVQHNRSQEEISRSWSYDTSALLSVHLAPFWTVGFGLGENSYQAQSQRYSLISLSYQF